MGSNKRYADYYDRQMNKRITELAIKPMPITLSDAELDVESDPIVKADRPIPVRGWVRYPESPTRVEGRAVAWTSRAVEIEWENAAGETRRAWVWSSAVERTG